MANHLKSLLRKNWILWKRNWCCSLIEILIPFFLIFSIVAIRKLATKTDIAERSFINQPPDLFGKGYGMYEFDPDIEGLQSPFHIYMKNCLNNTFQGEAWRNGVIGLAPENEITRKLSSYFKTAFNYSSKFLASNDEMDNYIQSEKYGNINPYLCLGITFDEFNTKTFKFAYRLKFNVTGPPQQSEVPNTLFLNFVKIANEELDENFKYIKNGFITVQNWIDNLIVQLSSPPGKYVEPVRIVVKEGSIKLPAYVKDDFASYVTGSFGILIVLPLMVVYLRLAYSIIYEKEKKLREGMKMMGLNNTQFYLSWIITYLIIYTLISVLGVSLLINQVFPHSSWIYLFLIYWLFCICLLFQSMFISVFFTKSLFGIIVSILFYLLMFLVIVIVQSNQNSLTDQFMWLASMSPQASISFAFDTILAIESQSRGLNSDTFTYMNNHYSVEMCLVMLMVNIVFYLLLFIYLD